MIFYFSATGNSEAVARQLASRLNDKAVNMFTVDPETLSLAGEEYLGFVFPIFAWAAPEVVLQFAKRIQPGDSFTFAVCTFSNVAGRALEQFSEYLPLKAGYGLVMPDNFPVFDKIVETEESACGKLAAAKPRLEQICQWLAEKKTVFDVLEGEDATRRTWELSDYFNKSQRKTAPFWVEREACISCGICKEACLACVIDLEDGMPVWRREDCFMCAACINRCPTAAIQYGEFSKGQFRYVFTSFERGEQNIKKESGGENE